jgi:hypothetical protein
MSEAMEMDRVLEDAFKSVRKGKIHRFVRIFTQWPAIVGEANARMARPAGLRGKTLVIKSEDSAWADKLRYMEVDLLKRIAEHVGVGCVTRLQFVVGEMERAAPEKRQQKKISAAQRRTIDRLLSAGVLDGKPVLKKEFAELFTGLYAYGRVRDGKRRRAGR